MPENLDAADVSLQSLGAGHFVVYELTKVFRLSVKRGVGQFNSAPDEKLDGFSRARVRAAA
jgi:hypothetical protein